MPIETGLTAQEAADLQAMRDYDQEAALSTRGITYPNFYGASISPFPLYSTPLMYLLWRDPAREDLRIKALNILDSDYRAFLSANGFSLDEALDKYKMKDFADQYSGTAGYGAMASALLKLATRFEEMMYSGQTAIFLQELRNVADEAAFAKTTFPTRTVNWNSDSRDDWWNPPAETVAQPAAGGSGIPLLAIAAAAMMLLG